MINDHHCNWSMIASYTPDESNVIPPFIYGITANAVRAYYNIESPTKMGPKFFDNFMRQCVDDLDFTNEKTGSLIQTVWIDRWTHKVLAKFLNKNQDQPPSEIIVLVPTPK
jgi:hypothetical protein